MSASILTPIYQVNLTQFDIHSIAFAITRKF